MSVWPVPSDVGRPAVGTVGLGWTRPKVCWKVGATPRSYRIAGRLEVEGQLADRLPTQRDATGNLHRRGSREGDGDLAPTRRDHGGQVRRGLLGVLAGEARGAGSFRLPALDSHLVFPRLGP